MVVSEGEAPMQRDAEVLVLRRERGKGKTQEQRPHRTLVLDSPEGRLPQPKPGATATLVSRQVLGGLHHEYEWAAA
jgi:hypothetical protein